MSTDLELFTAVEAAFVEQTRGEGGLVQEDGITLETVSDVFVHVVLADRWTAILSMHETLFEVPLRDGPLRDAPVQDVVDWLREVTDCKPDQEDGMTPDITVGRQTHLRAPEVATQVWARHKADEEISDACAATIASWWQGPGEWSQEFTRLSTAGVFNPSALLQEISVARGEVNTKIDELALDMLATWAMHRHDAEVT